MRRAAGAGAALLLLAAPGRAGARADVQALIAEGDAHYAQRASGARGAVADPREVEEALAAYRRALALEPESLTVLFRLQRALHFRGAFCGADRTAQAAVFDEGRRLGQAVVERLEGGLAAVRGDARVAALRKIENAAEVYYWTAACWGQWGLAKGKLSAARTGVASRVRALAHTVVDLDPTLEEGGGYRILGRLHDQAPHIPFITGWVSKEKAVAYLRRSREIAPQNSVTAFFLAEALLDDQPSRAAEARELLLSCASAPPRPEYAVEDAFYAQQARERLSKLK